MTTFERQSRLNRLVRNIIETHPEGLRHSEIVRKILEMGYEHDGDTSLSATVHTTLKNLVVLGLLNKEENEYGVREYLPADADLVLV